MNTCSPMLSENGDSAQKMLCKARGFPRNTGELSGDVYNPAILGEVRGITNVGLAIYSLFYSADHSGDRNGRIGAFCPTGPPNPWGSNAGIAYVGGGRMVLCIYVAAGRLEFCGQSFLGEVQVLRHSSRAHGLADSCPAILGKCTTARCAQPGAAHNHAGCHIAACMDQ